MAWWRTCKGRAGARPVGEGHDRSEQKGHPGHGLRGWSSSGFCGTVRSAQSLQWWLLRASEGECGMHRGSAHTYQVLVRTSDRPKALVML
ncbi:predicted protein [Arabidopsis lyrata subsp. lyrata]|uniref:Predicted protein n=1 Tax=Arabidopsis lyrata subsp. lyrata TaxID=81972 RepID=D7MVU2_ARALL|nr:predicted protein [Arabidopsis lyrata subsp. lyrata]